MTSEIDTDLRFVLDATAWPVLALLRSPMDQSRTVRSLFHPLVRSGCPFTWPGDA